MSKTIKLEKAKLEINIKTVESMIHATEKKLQALKTELEAHKTELELIIEQEKKHACINNCEFVMNWHEGHQFFDSEDIEMDREQLESTLKLVASFAPKTTDNRGYNKFKFTVKVAGCEISYRIDLNKEHASMESLIEEALWEQCRESILFGSIAKENCLSYILLKNEWGKDLLDQNLDDWHADYKHKMASK